MIRGRHFLSGWVACLLLAASATGEEPCRSGLEPGQRPGPYAFVLSTGDKRGQSFCYICDTADHPAVVVFARTLSDPLAKLVSQLDKGLKEKQTAGLRAWVTFLGEDQTALDPKIVAWAQQHAIRAVPLGVFEDAGGPPSYRLSRDADVTVLLFVKRRVAVNFAFRSGELTEDRVKDVVKSLLRILPAAKGK